MIVPPLIYLQKILFVLQPRNIHQAKFQLLFSMSGVSKVISE